AGPEANQSCVAVVEPASEAEGLETRIRVADDVAELIVVHALDDLAGDHVHYQPGTADMVGDDAIGGAGFDEEIGNVVSAGVDELADEIACTVKFGNGLQPVLVQEALG